MPEKSEAKISYYITDYEKRLLSVLCMGDRPVQASFSRMLPQTDEAVPSAFAVGTILVGRVNRVVSNIRAAFVDIAPGVQGFLPFGNILSPIYLDDGSRIHQDLQMPKKNIVQGDCILVQVEKAAVKTKDLVLTTHLTLSGRYIVLDHADSGIHISQKASPKQKARIHDFLSENGIAASAFGQYGCIVRTNACSLQDFTPMLNELAELQKALERLITYASSRTLYSVLYTPPADYLIALRDTYALSFQRIVTDIPAVYEQLKDYFTQHGDAESLEKLFFFDNGKKTMSLLNFYRLGERIKEALGARVWLKSGGYLVIEPTESLTAIDVNSGKYTGTRSTKSGAEETFFKVNAEAAEMIAEQLRLRNLSGMILVDFINMKEPKKNEQLLELLRTYTSSDPVHTSVIDMTPLGLVEITRKKIRKSLKEQYDETAFHE